MAEYQVERGDTIPLFLGAFKSSGGVNGLFPVAAIRDGLSGSNTPVYLDFATGAFTISGWTTRLQTLTQVSTSLAPGHYSLTGGFDLTTTVGLPPNTNKLLVEYEVRNATGAVRGATSDTIILGDSWYAGGASDWSAAEKNEIRAVLGVTGTQSTPGGGGQVQEILTDTRSMQPLIDVAVGTRAASGSNMGLLPTAIDSTATAVDSLLSGNHGDGAWDGGTDPSSVAFLVWTFDTTGIASLVQAGAILTDIRTAVRDTLPTQIGSLDTRVASVATEVGSISTAISSLVAQIAALTTSVASEIYGRVIDATNVETITFFEVQQYLLGMVTGTIVRSANIYGIFAQDGTTELYRLRDDDPAGRSRVLPNSFAV